MPPAARAPVDTSASDSRLESDWVESAVRQRRRRLRPPVVRARSLLLLGLLGATAVVLWLRLLASEPHLPLVWRLAESGAIELDSSSDPALRPHIGQQLRSMVLADGQRIEPGLALLPRSPRWIVDDTERQQQDQLRALVGQAVHQPSVTLQLGTGQDPLVVTPRPRGLAGLGTLCWLLCGLALALLLAGSVVLLAEPGLPAILYGLMALSQGANLLLIGAEALPGMGLPTGQPGLDLALRLLADATTAAALVHVLLRYPRRLDRARWLAPPAWAVALCGVALALLWPPVGLWWWAQGLSIGYGMLAAALLHRPHGQPHNPLARQLQRLVLAGTGTLLLLNLAIATASREGQAQYHLATIGSTTWYVFFASLLVLGPFLSSSRQALRDFTMLAGVATVASSLGLLFLSLFSLNPGVALLLALAVTLAMFALARPWILGQLSGSATLSGERMFDSLYRAARDLEQAPEQASPLIASLLREVFDPLEVGRTGRPVSRIRVANDGSTMVVPVIRLPDPALPGAAAPAPDAAKSTPEGAIVLRFAGRGRRLFTLADAQLCERLIEQLRRAVAYDRAVEHGRTEERTRIAQDLHDDIGARLLTLMYKAPNPEIEEYIRHTLQDLKTLTRGLAASNHRLSHAAAEWKADITQRLNATGCDLRWSFSADRDLTLSVVQWSGLTRVLRELVNNIISHAQATQVEITAQFEKGRLTLLVSDDGIGQAPAGWSHGLGLGGVRKRVKLLGGHVAWVERDLRGIRCEVRVSLAADKG